MKDYEKFLQNEETLDNPDFAKMREIGKKMIDDAVDYLQNLSEKPVWQEIPALSKKFFQEDLPKSGAALEDVYSEFKKHIFPYHSGNIHPRYFSWVQGNGTLSGAFADMMASVMNPNVTIAEHSAMYVDAQVINWAKEMMGFPKSASGMLLSGASMANVTALIVARNAFENRNIKKRGLKSISAQMVFYCSKETHSSMQKAAEALGLGADAVRKIDVNAAFQIKIDELEKQIMLDKKQGLLPFCITANCGAVNSGAIDDLAAIHNLCKKYNLWFHIDGAFGAAAKLTDEFSAQLQMIEQADSLAFDFHKWFNVNYEVGCVLIRDAKKHREAFAIAANYLTTHERGLIGGPDSLNNYGIELSRGFKALKVWMIFKEHGSEKFKRMIRQNIAQIFYLADLIKKEESLELMCEPVLNVLCYRFKANLPLEKLNELNKELLQRMQEQGIAAPSCSMIGENYVIRVCNVNHRARKSDFEILVKESARIGREIAAT